MKASGWKSGLRPQELLTKGILAFDRSGSMGSYIGWEHAGSVPPRACVRLMLSIWSVEGNDRRARERCSPSGRSGSWGHALRVALTVAFTLLTACAESRLDQEHTHEPRTEKAITHPDRDWTAERKALYQQAREGLRRSRERYIETTRPVLQRKFRDEYPNLGERDIEALVNDSLEKGFRPEAARSPDGPIRQPPMHCLPSTWGGPPQTNCY